jgi:hypothetical protein
VDADLVRSVGPDVVMIATGSRPTNDGVEIWRPGRAMPGWGSLPNFTSWDVLSGKVTGKTVVVYDDYGHYEGIDVVDRLLADGATVHYATRFHKVGERLEAGIWETAGRPHQRAMINNPAFTFHPNSVVDSITSDSVTLASVDAAQVQQKVTADAIVLVSSTPVNNLIDELASVSVQVIAIGDADGIRTLEGAVYEAHTAAFALTPEKKVSVG